MLREPKDSIAWHAKQVPPEEIRETFSSLPIATNLLDHQWQALLLGMDQDRFLFALDMGLGKTCIALNIFNLRREMNEVHRGLVICPPPVLWHWSKEVAKHTPDLSVAVVCGTAEEKINKFNTATEDLVVVSNAWFTRLMSKGLKSQTMAKSLEERISHFDCLIVDEAHTLKNAAGVGFRGFGRFLMDIPYRYLLTGTPIGNNYLSVFALYYMMDGGDTYGESYNRFLAKWFRPQTVHRRSGQPFLIWNLNKTLQPAFIDRFWKKAVRWEEGECNDLPQKKYVTHYVEMEGDQRRQYYDALNGGVFNSSGLYGLMRITGGVGMQSSAKLEALNYFVSELVVERKEMLIVWHWLDAEGEMLMSELAKKFPRLRIGEARGAVSQTKKNEYLEKWHAKKLDILVANVKSLGVGIDLYEARHEIFYSNNFSVIDRAQAEKRIHRQGQTRNCTYIDLVCQDSIDAMILNMLRTKRDSTARAIRDALIEEISQS